MRKVISVLVVVSVLSVISVFEVSGASIAIRKLSKKTAGPFDVIKIFGAGFTKASDMRVIFASGAYAVTVPAIYGTKTSLDVGVPVFIDKKTGAIKSGVVKVTVKSKSLGIKSNTLTGFKITDLPRTTQAAGTVTQAFLEDLKTLTGFTRGQLDFLQKASKGKVNTTKAKSGVSKMATKLGALQTTLAAILKDQAITQGFSVKINKASLAVSDRLILGFLAQLDAVVKAPHKTCVTAALERDWVPPDGLAIPSLTEIYEKLASYAEEKGFDQQVLFEYLKRSGAWVGTAAGTLTVLSYMTAAVTPAVAAAAGSVALVYGIGITSFVLTNYVCFYLGLPSGVNEAEGFWPLLEDVSRTFLGMTALRLANVCRLKKLLDIFDLALNERDVANQLEEPVKKAAPKIFKQFHSLTVEGAWSGKIYIKWEGEELQGFFAANFTESGLSLSGVIQCQVGSNEGYKLDVSGTICGYLISFDWHDSGVIGSFYFEEFWEFNGNLSGDGTKLAGTHEYHEYMNGSELRGWTGTWTLSR